jgi:HSP20 family molecular chaperone IbpA
MDRIFDNFLGREPIGWPSLSRTMPTAVTPDVDVHETGKEIIFEAELPGIDEKDINVMVPSLVFVSRNDRSNAP